MYFCLAMNRMINPCLVEWEARSRPGTCQQECLDINYHSIIFVVSSWNLNQALVMMKYFLGGNTVDACNIKVNIEEKSALSYSKTVLWELEDSKKAIGAANLLSSTWNHVTIDLPASSKETLITMEVEHNYDLFGGSGIDNMVISSTRKCNPRYHQTVSFK